MNKRKKKNMLSGVKIENEIYQFSDIVPGEKQSSNQWFSVCMLTGKNREVRKLFESQELEVSRLKRVRIGPIFLPATLREGSCINFPGAVPGLYTDTVLRAAALLQR